MAGQQLGGDGATQITQVGGEVNEKIVDGEHADKAAVPYHGQAPQRVFAEHCIGVVQIPIGVDRDEGADITPSTRASASSPQSLIGKPRAGLSPALALVAMRETPLSSCGAVGWG